MIHRKQKLHIALREVKLACGKLHVVKLSDGIAVCGVVFHNKLSVSRFVGVQLFCKL